MRCIVTVSGVPFLYVRLLEPSWGTSCFEWRAADLAPQRHIAPAPDWPVVVQCITTAEESRCLEIGSTPTLSSFPPDHQSRLETSLETTYQ